MLRALNLSVSKDLNVFVRMNFKGMSRSDVGSIRSDTSILKVISSDPVGLFFLPLKLKLKFCADIRNYFIRISSQRSLKSKSDFQVFMTID